MITLVQGPPSSSPLVVIYLNSSDIKRSEFLGLLGVVKIFPRTKQRSKTNILSNDVALCESRLSLAEMEIRASIGLAFLYVWIANNCSS